MIVYQAHPHGLVLALAILLGWLQQSARLDGDLEFDTLDDARNTNQKYLYGEHLVVDFATLAISQSIHIVDPQRDLSPIQNHCSYSEIFMAAEPSVGRRRLHADGPGEAMSTILEEMDKDLAALDENTSTAAAAATPVNEEAQHTRPTAQKSN